MSSALAIEELDPEFLFQGLDLVAYRALGDEQLLSRAREAFVARRGLEGLQRIERGARLCWFYWCATQTHTTSDAQFG